MTQEEPFSGPAAGGASARLRSASETADFTTILLHLMMKANSSTQTDYHDWIAAKRAEAEARGGKPLKYVPSRHNEGFYLDGEDDLPIPRDIKLAPGEIYNPRTGEIATDCLSIKKMAEELGITSHKLTDEMERQGLVKRVLDFKEVPMICNPLGCRRRSCLGDPNRTTTEAHPDHPKRAGAAEGTDSKQGAIHTEGGAQALHYSSACPWRKGSIRHRQADWVTTEHCLQAPERAARGCLRAVSFFRRFPSKDTRWIDHRRHLKADTNYVAL
jgi:hypothetical protein